MAKKVLKTVTVTAEPPAVFDSVKAAEAWLEHYLGLDMGDGASMESCGDCVRKHLATALEGLNEAHTGYGLHRWTIVVAHLNHAEIESRYAWPDIANKIMVVRRMVIKSKKASAKMGIAIRDLIVEVTAALGEDDIFANQASANKVYDVLTKFAPK